MKLLMYRYGGKSLLGALVDGHVVDVGAARALVGGAPPPATLDELIAAGPEAWNGLTRAVTEVGVRLKRDAAGLRAATIAIPEAEAEILAPVRPSKVVAIGLNYLDHCREQHIDPPPQPTIFAKFPTSVIGPGETIEYSTALTQKVDYEAELAVVIGRKARNVREEEALDYVFGYTAANDVTARDLQRGDGQWVRGKSLDTFCPLGPVVVTTDEIPDPQVLGIRSILNGQVMQDSNTKELIFGVRHLIAFASAAFTLLPGDVLLTGTPAGVGMHRDPPVYMGDGDVVRIEVEGIGALANPVRVVG